MIGFKYLFNAEKAMLKQERDHLTTEKTRFAQERKHQYEELKADKQRWQENKDKVEKLFNR